MHLNSVIPIKLAQGAMLEPGKTTKPGQVDLLINSRNKNTNPETLNLKEQR